MYCVGRNVVNRRKQPELHELFSKDGRLSKALCNAALFRIRQNFTSRNKDAFTENELEIRAEIEATCKMYGKAAPKAVISYNFLEKLMRATENPDFFAGLPMQTAQHCLKKEVQDFKNWLSALRAWKKEPSGFTGRPKMPCYLKGDMTTVIYTNQDCVVYRGGGRCLLKFPGTKARLEIMPLPEDAILKEVKVKPCYGDFEVLYTYECEEPACSTDLSNLAAVDLGVDNIAAIATNEGHSLLVKGGAVKAENQWFNKRRAFLVSELTKGHVTDKAPQSKALQSLSKHRTHFMLDACHQISCRIVDFCFEHRVAILYIGRNRFWKQNVGMGKTNNQKFVSIPFAMLRELITYKAERAGIRVILSEESYTSQASLIDGDYIPTYGVDDDATDFSGRRFRRGLYRSSDGTVVNADLNAAANILRKAKQDAFQEISNYDFLKNPEVLYYTGLHDKRNPVEGITAV